MLNSSLIIIREALAKFPYVVNIKSPDDYKCALKLINELIVEYESNKKLVDLLADSIERWENKADEFTAFNMAVAGIAPGIAVLKTLMSQYHLRVGDLSELGSKSNVRKLLNATDGRRLTRQHIEALSKRFAVSPSLFFPDYP